jgi:hypothetical protein
VSGPPDEVGGCIECGNAPFRKTRAGRLCFARPRSLPLLTGVEPLGAVACDMSHRATARGNLNGRTVVRALVMILGGTTALLAYASPSDPTWIAGIYDNADYDDVFALVTDGSCISSGPGPARVERGPVARVPFPERGPVPDRTLRTQMSRGPPGQAHDTIVSLQPKSATPSTFCTSPSVGRTN